MSSNTPWWGPITALALVFSTWFACILCGLLYGAHVGWTLFVLFELRAMFAGLLKVWRYNSRQPETANCAKTVRIHIS